MDLATLRRC